MTRILLTAFVLLACFVFTQFASAQVPTAVLVKIVRAEDERRYDATLENLLKDASAKIRARAALAAGRIGDENSIPALTNLLKDDSVEVQTMAMFALGETESAKASEAILEFLKFSSNDFPRARAIEAAGKIAAANPKDQNTPKLGEAIVSTLNQEFSRSRLPSYEVVSLGETAILRARPAGGEELMVRLLKEPNAHLRADALNTLARLRSKKANAESRELLQKNSDPVVRANAARMLGVGEDKSAIDLLLNAATKDSDSRVRVSAIRALGNLKDGSAAEKLIPDSIEMEARAANLKACRTANTAMFAAKNFSAVLPCEDFKSEHLEIAVALGRLVPNSNNLAATDFLQKFRRADNFESSETEIAYAQIAPEKYVKEFSNPPNPKDLQVMKTNYRPPSSIAQGLGELAKNTDNKIKSEAEQILNSLLYKYQINASAVPDVLTAYSAFKPKDLNRVLLEHLKHNDSIIRAAAAGLLADQTATKENVEALKSTFAKSLLTDKHENDAQLAILDALYKLDKKSSVGIFLTALDAPDYLVRKKAFDILADQELQKDFPGIVSSLENARAKKKNQILPYAAYTGTRLGQTLNSQADYTRAVSRKNGTVKAVLTTTKGSFTISFSPEDAPLTVDNFIKLARSNYFNGVSVHRVVPNFVMQDGDPRGDGNGGPGWQIRCEINMLQYERGAVGMALSGKDTGGSQWFVTHSPQPHLDGGYTVFGKVNETDMKVVDQIVRGDKILSVRIIENRLPRKGK